MSYEPQNVPHRRKRQKKSAAPLLLLLAVIAGVVVAAVWMMGSKSPQGEDESSSSGAPESSVEVDAQVSSEPTDEISKSSSEASESSSQGNESSSEADKDSEAEPSPAPSEVSSQLEPTQNGDWQLVLVNPTHKLDGDYDVELATAVGDYKLDARITGDMQAMIAAAKADGYKLEICSAYRSTERSRILYTNKVNQLVNSGMPADAAAVEAAKWVAPPGTSEHNTGLAADIVSADYFTKFAELEHDFETFPEFTWLYENCAEYGFVLRFPKDKQEITGITYEPWHYRYVGKEHAKKIMEQKICLEEYLQQG